MTVDGRMRWEALFGLPDALQDCPNGPYMITAVGVRFSSGIYEPKVYLVLSKTMAAQAVCSLQLEREPAPVLVGCVKSVSNTRDT